MRISMERAFQVEGTTNGKGSGVGAILMCSKNSEEPVGCSAVNREGGCGR